MENKTCSGETNEKPKSDNNPPQFNKTLSIKEARIRNITHLYYSRPEVQRAIYEFSRNREISPRYFEGFGKRPDSFQYKGDIFELVKRGATSFHCSEELWEDPLKISTDLKEQEIKKLRTGWDLLIDIDCKWFDYSKLAAQAIVKVLNNHGIKNVGVKFSVSGDTPILVKEKEEINLLEISKVIELLKNGKKLEVLSLDKERKLKFSKIYNSLEHLDTVYELKHTQSTLPLKVTEHHSVFIWNKGEIIQKKVKDLKEGEFLISFNTTTNQFQTNNIQVINEFEFAKNQHSKKTISRKININKELMRLIGYFLAEGHVTNTINQVGFTFNKNEEEYIKDVTELLSSITKRKISIRNPNENSIQILIHSKEWSNFFDVFCGKKKNKHVPAFAFKASRELFLELLRGYIRGDGYKIGEYGITVKSVSKKLITEMIWLCKLNDLSCNLSKEKNKPHILPQGTLFKGGLVYMLKIPKSEISMLEFNRIRNKFSPFAGDKIFPVDGLKEVYKQIKPKKFVSHRLEHETFRTKKRANLNRIRKVLDWFYNFNSVNPDETSKKILSNYEKLFDSDISVVEIKKINKKEKALVYDVSVEETESFFGNHYPILLHNSGSKGWHILIPWKAFPKELGEEQTKDLFPDLPRKIVGYITDKARPELEKMLPEDFYEQFKKTDLKRGVKCSICNQIAQSFIQVELYCSFCGISEIKKINNDAKQKCAHCKRELEIRNQKNISECNNCNTTNDLLNRTKKQGKFSEPVQNDKEDLFDLMGLDFVLVSPRHLFRMPYSLHEKTALASIVIDSDKIKDFEMKDADPMKIEIKDFNPDVKEGEATELVIQAMDWFQENKIRRGVVEEKITGKYADYKPLKLENLSEDNFPPCVKRILNGIVDGRKRALFILIHLFRSIGMDKEEIEKKIYEWNKKNEHPLNEGYIKSQLQWAYRKKPIMPQNCKEFYQGIGVCVPDNLCDKIKNPVNYVVKKNYMQNNFSQKNNDAKNSEKKKDDKPKKEVKKRAPRVKSIREKKVGVGKVVEEGKDE